MDEGSRLFGKRPHEDRGAIRRAAGATEIELRERKDRVEDALNSTAAAAAEGIVPGGGVALVQASQELEQFRSDNEPAKEMGYMIVRHACIAPLNKIVSNAGGEPIRPREEWRS